MGKERGDLLQGTLDMLVLKALQLQPMHGWGITERIEQWSESVLQLGQGTLYPALYRLERQGLIASDWRTTANNRRARYYALTRAGRRHFSDELVAVAPDVARRQPRARRHARRRRGIMSWIGERWYRLRSVVRRDAIEDGLNEEMRFHIDQQTEKNIRPGHDARRSAPPGARQVRRPRARQGRHARRIPAGALRGFRARSSLRRASARCARPASPPSPR